MASEERIRGEKPPVELKYIHYEKNMEKQYLPAIRALISKDLSEPYSIYVYRYFLYEWAELCFLVCFPSPIYVPSNTSQAIDPRDSSLVGVIINKLEPHHSHSPPTLRGYIAMLAVSSSYRGHGIATTLVRKAIDAMIARDADEVVLETEVQNTAAMKLYERLGFLRSKKLHRYYLSGNTAYRLGLSLKSRGEADRGWEERERRMGEEKDGNVGVLRRQAVV